MRSGDSGNLPVECLAAVPGVIAANYRLADVAAALACAVQRLRNLARRGEFPRLFKLSRNDWRVQKADLELWAQGRWECAQSLQVRAQAVRGSIRQPAWLRRRPRT